MKQVFSGILILIIGLSASAQITLEKEYHDGGMDGIPSAFIANDKLYYYEIDNNFETDKSTFILYDENHQVVKSSLFQSADITEISQVFLPSDNLFNNDGLIEFIACYSTLSSGDTDLMAIFNENGQKLFDLGNYNSVSYIKTPHNEYKLLVHYSHDNKGMAVYSLPGVLTSMQEETLNKISSSASPNPAGDFINIAFDGNFTNTEKIDIFNGKGQFIDTKSIDAGAKSITIYTSAYSKGLYIYKIGNEQGKFVIK